MRPTIDFLIEKFRYYNSLCFKNVLPIPPMRLNLRYSQMGVTKFRTVVDDKGVISYDDFSIEISIRRDLPENEYIDTLVHEMIHYYILYKNLQDDSPHGTLYKRIMSKLNKEYGLSISIYFDPSDEYLLNQISRSRFICVVLFENEQMGFAVVAKNKLFEFWKTILKIDKIKEVKWYVSNRAIFERFPVAVSISFMEIEADKMHHYLYGAKELENTGDVIRVKQ